MTIGYLVLREGVPGARGCAWAMPGAKGRQTLSDLDLV